MSKHDCPYEGYTRGAEEDHKCGNWGFLCDMCKEDRADIRAVLSGLCCSPHSKIHNPNGRLDVAARATYIIANLKAVRRRQGGASQSEV